MSISAEDKPTALELATTEKQFQEQVVGYAALRGWKVFHPHHMQRSSYGYPDLTLARGDRLVFAELKTERGKLSEQQTAWLDTLRQTPAEVYVWRPSSWGDLEQVLR
jgi:hypothetical protein